MFLLTRQRGGRHCRTLATFSESGTISYASSAKNKLPARHSLYVLEDQPGHKDQLTAEFEELTQKLHEYRPLNPIF